MLSMFFLRRHQKLRTVVQTVKKCFCAYAVHRQQHRLNTELLSSSGNCPRKVSNFRKSLLMSGVSIYILSVVLIAADAGNESQAGQNQYSSTLCL